MSDGAKKNKGLILCTDNFSWQEVVLLMNILKIKFDINSKIYLEKNKPRIYISQLELVRIKDFLKPYFISHFYYKLHL